MKILIVANTTIGKRGNIGDRLYNIYNFSNNDIYIYSRGATARSKNITWLVGYSFFSRFLNFLRLFINKKFESRIVDNKIFSIQLYFYLSLINVKFDIIHIVESDINILNVVSKFYNKNKIIVELQMNIFSDEHNSHLISTAQRKMYDGILTEVSNFIVPSEYIYNELLKLNFNNCSLIPFYCTKINNNSIKNKNKNKNTKIKFLFVGNITYRKGVHLLLDAWDKISNAELHLYGRLNYSEFNVTQLKRKNIYYHGYTDKINSMYKNYDIFIFPTLMEGSAKVTYEAMANGLPVITTRMSGSVVVDDYTGKIIEPNVRDILDAVNYFINNNQKIGEYKNNCFLQIEKYSVDNYIRNVDLYYDRILNNN